MTDRGNRPSAFSRDCLAHHPFGSMKDVIELERVPLRDRLACTNFADRLRSALTARSGSDTAVYYIEDGNIDRNPERFSFSELLERIDRTSALLRSHGIGKDDVVAVLLPAVPQLFWSVIAAMSTGIVFPMNWMLEPKHLLHLISESRAKAIIALGPTPNYSIWEAVSSFANELRSGTMVWSVPGPGGRVLPVSDLDTNSSMETERSVEAASVVTSDKIAAYLHSGGTTGLPKIIKISHFSMSYRHWMQAHLLRQEFGETLLHDSPIFHSGGLCGRCLPPLASGATLVVPSAMGARDKNYIRNYWKFIEKYRVTRTSGVPTMLGMLTKSPPTTQDLSSLKPIGMTGSTAMPVSVRREFERLAGIRILNSYGMTENTASIAADPPDGPSKDGASGIRLPYTEIRVVKRDDGGSLVRHCDADEIGLIEIRGAGLTPGYLNPEHQESSHTDDGWLKTGDLGKLDNDGYVFVTGRAKDVIIRGGHNIDPSLLEEPLLALPDVLFAAAVGKPDSHAGELPIAYVQLVAGSKMTGVELIEYLREHISERAAIPKEIIIVDELPLTTIGKPMKSRLRQDAAERAFSEALTKATGLEIGVSLDVSLRDHPQYGSILCLEVSFRDECDQGRIANEIRRTLDAYAIKYDIRWRQAADS
jgi:fatty-acyl-CoA synthase